MPDISMCQNQSCPKKKQCYRYTATPNGFQSYSDFQHNGGKCAHFMTTKGMFSNKHK